jgi:outer membrane protein TolC
MLAPILAVSVAMIAAALFTDARAAESGLLSYEEARTALYEVSDSLKAGQAGVSHSQNEARAANTLGYPELSVSATEIFGEKSGTLEGTPLGNLSFRDNLRGPRSSISTTWPIYTGGRIRATQKGLAAGVEAANAELDHTEEDLDVLLAKEYFGLELAANVERTRVQALQQADRELERAIQFEKQGVIPRVERLSAQVSRDETAREQVRAQRDREIAEASLRRLLHRDTDLGTSTPLFISTQPLKPLTEWLRHATSSNPTLAVLEARRKQAEQGVSVEEARWGGGQVQIVLPRRSGPEGRFRTGDATPGRVARGRGRHRYRD